MKALAYIVMTGLFLTALAGAARAQDASPVPAGPEPTGFSTQVDVGGQGVPAPGSANAVPYPVETPLVAESVAPPAPGAEQAQAPPPPAQRFDPGAAAGVTRPFKALVDGERVNVRRTTEQYSGVMVPDGEGGYVWMAQRMAPLNPVNEAARELKLIVRELADQLAEGPIAVGASAWVALPTSFVSQDNFEETSSFGRYLGEQMMYEFARRGYQTNEYRMDSAVTSRPGEGDFLLSRRVAGPNRNQQRLAFLVGTYYADPQNVFVNARLVEGPTGRVLRAANVVFPQTPVTQQMLANRSRQLQEAFVNVKDYDTMAEQATLTDIDRGFDVR